RERGLVCHPCVRHRDRDRYKRETEAAGRQEKQTLGRLCNSTAVYQSVDWWVTSNGVYLSLPRRFENSPRLAQELEAWHVAWCRSRCNRCLPPASTWFSLMESCNNIFGAAVSSKRREFGC
ncbi:unnamed protein product, partial [Ectocarpus sp. 12 AP-2014]